MNKLAEALGLDPVEFRMRNLLTEGALLSVNSPLPKGVTITEVVKDCALAFGWQQTPMAGKDLQKKHKRLKKGYLRRGKGFALHLRMLGFIWRA